MKDLLIKDAGTPCVAGVCVMCDVCVCCVVYNAVAITPYDLYEQLDFEQWFQTHLVNELAITDPRCARFET